MQTIKRAAKKFAEQFDDTWTAKASFYEGVKFAQKWISIEDELPQYYQTVLADNGEYITVITRVSDGVEDFILFVEHMFVCILTLLNGDQ